MNAGPARLRFATPRDLYASFPTAQIEVGVDASDEPSLAFVKRLASEGDIGAALSYCAYLISRREAVLWGCDCIRQTELRGAREAQCFQIAENWAKDPTDANRRAALDFGSQSHRDAPATWLALAAAWSGGSIGEADGVRIVPPQQLSAQAVRGALLIARGRLARTQAAKVEAQWIADGLRWAAGGLQSR